MLKKDSAGIRGQGPKRPQRVQSGAALCGGMDRVGIEGLGALGLLAVFVAYGRSRLARRSSDKTRESVVLPAAS